VNATVANRADGARSPFPTPLRCAGEFERQTATLVHELMHALGFSNSNFPWFRRADGSPLTPRDAQGYPPFAVVDGLRRYSLGDYGTTVVNSQMNGKAVSKMVTPNVLRVGREHFGCGSLDGVELEDGGTTSSANS
jgi:leishmanolysin-like peptidase